MQCQSPCTLSSNNEQDDHEDIQSFLVLAKFLLKLDDGNHGGVMWKVCVCVCVFWNRRVSEQASHGG